MRTMVILADISQVPCPDCGSTDVDRIPAPSKGDGEERISSSCAGCGADRGSSTRDMHGRVRNTPLVYPKGQTAPQHKAAKDYRLLGLNDKWETRCTHPGCGFRLVSEDQHEAVRRIENHVRCHKNASKIASADDIQKVKDALNHCDAYGSVSMWLDPNGKITVVDWHGGESQIQRKFDDGYVRLHWDSYGFIVHFTPPLKPLQGVALFSLLEAIHMSSVTTMTSGGGVHVDSSGNPSKQMGMIRNAALEIRDFDGEVGNERHITRKEEGTLPTSAVANLFGARGEMPGQHRNRQGAEWDAFVDDIRTNGIREPIFITVDYGKAPKLSEGNHRRDAAVEAGLPEVPVEIAYYGHAEQQHEVR